MGVKIRGLERVSLCGERQRIYNKTSTKMDVQILQKTIYKTKKRHRLLDTSIYRYKKRSKQNPKQLKFIRN